MRMQSVEAKEITEAEEGLSGVKRNRMGHRWEEKISRGVFLLLSYHTPASGQVPQVLNSK